MDKRYELYCLTDPRFYDSPDRTGANDSGFLAADRPLPEGWERTATSEWLVYRPAAAIPAQGWKIHVSACRHNADAVLAAVWDYCVPRGIYFKHLRSRLALHMRNAKYAPREASGKLVTIYPASDEHLEVILRELDALLAGQPGPYILSDLRYGDGPLYVRYGGFAQRRCRNSKGELVPAIEEASGRLVPDERRPVFYVPPWVTMPEFLRPHLAARNSVSLASMPYRLEGAIHFSNGGGVYLAEDKRSGRRVVLKEARPYAGLAADGADAVARLRRERDILRRLAGLAAVPGVQDYFQVGEHHFLVLDYIDGRPLNSFFAHRHPLIGPDPEPARVAAYTDWALRICRGVEEAVATVHARGVVINDLHMFNVMVRPDDTVALIDFEVAALVDEGRRPTIGNPGFVAPRERTGFGIDRYALGCLRLAMFMPLTSLLGLQLSKAEELAEAIAETFPVPSAFLDEALDDIAGLPVQPPPSSSAPSSSPPSLSPSPRQSRPWARAPKFQPTASGLIQARQLMTRAITASATPHRPDRLFPGDIHQFADAGGGLNLAYGAAGVLYALDQAGATILPAHVEWLIDRSTRPEPGTKVGLYSGLLGVAYVLERLGHPGAARKIAELSLGEAWEQLGSDLHDGLSGVALALLHLGEALAEPRLREAGERALAIVAGRGPQRPDGAHAGLMRGATGPALLFIRAYERTGDSGYLDLAATALASDLDGCVSGADGSLRVDEGWRTLPYLAAGSAGIGLVIGDYLAHRQDERLAGAVAGIQRAASSAFYIQPGLFSGRAGLILYLARQWPGDPVTAAHVQRLSWHAIRCQGGIAFPGDMLYRLSMDLATGTAGVLLGLAAAAGQALPGLPFLGNHPASGSTCSQASGRPRTAAPLGGPAPGPAEIARGNGEGGDN